MWSLCTEVAFYLLLPLLPAPGPRRPRRRRAAPAERRLAGRPCSRRSAWSGRSWSRQIPGHEGHYAQWLPGYLPWFLVGVCFAAAVREPGRRPAAAPARAARPRPGRLLGARRRRLRHRLLAGRRPAHAADPRRLGGRGQGGAVHRGRRVLPAAAGLRARARRAGPAPGSAARCRSGWATSRTASSRSTCSSSTWSSGSSTSRSSPATSSRCVLGTLLLTLLLATASFYLFERRILRAKDIRFFSRLDAGARPVRATVR